MEPETQTDHTHAAPAQERRAAFRVPLSRIVGLHDAISKTIQELCLPPLRAPFKQLSSDSGFSQWLAIQPIQVARVRGRLRCVGNVRAFQAMRSIFHPGQEICCIDLGICSDEQVSRGFVAEMIYSPALLGHRSKDVTALYKALLLAEQSGLWSPPDPIDRHVARLLGIDPRRLNKKVQGHQTANGQPGDVAGSNQETGGSGPPRIAPE